MFFHADFFIGKNPESRIKEYAQSNQDPNIRSIAGSKLTNIVEKKINTIESINNPVKAMRIAAFTC